MSRGLDATARLQRNLAAMARAAGLAITIEDICAAPWASALFVGKQIRLSLCGPDTVSFAAWVCALQEAEFTLHGHLVIDIAVELVTATDDLRRYEVLALLIEDRADGPL